METKQLFDSEHAASGTSPVEDVEELYGEAVTPIQWLMRTYQTGQEWYRKAREVLFSVNGDSAAARNRVASILRSYFVTTNLEAEDVERWKKGENIKETIRITPPRLKDSNATYIDWVYIADFLLLPCISITDEIEAENTKRNGEFDNAMRSYRKRLAV